MSLEFFRTCSFALVMMEGGEGQFCSSKWIVLGVYVCMYVCPEVGDEAVWGADYGRLA